MTSHIHHAFKRTIWIYRDVVFIVPIMLRRVLRPPGYRNDHLFFRCHGTHITILSWFNSCSSISCPLIPEVVTSGYDFSASLLPFHFFRGLFILTDPPPSAALRFLRALSSSRLSRWSFTLAWTSVGAVACISPALSSRTSTSAGIGIVSGTVNRTSFLGTMMVNGTLKTFLFRKAFLALC